MTLEDDRWCFACGQENPFGLQTRWTIDPDGTARARFAPERRHQGWRGVVHGGILATLMDEAMAQCVRSIDSGGVTAEMTVRFKKPAPTSGALLVEASILSAASRAFRLVSSVRGEDGTVYAEGQGLYIRMGRKTASAPDV